MLSPRGSARPTSSSRKHCPTAGATCWARSGSASSRVRSCAACSSSGRSRSRWSACSSPWSQATPSTRGPTVFFSVASLLNLEVDLLFFDTTSTCFELEEDDGEDGLRRYGKSKDERDDLPQVVIGLAVTRGGIPVRCWVWPGNTADASTVEEVQKDLAGWRLNRVVWVLDRGFSGEEQRASATC